MLEAKVSLFFFDSFLIYESSDNDWTFQQISLSSSDLPYPRGSRLAYWFYLSVLPSLVISPFLGKQTVMIPTLLSMVGILAVILGYPNLSN